jgi:hypothetical protein
MFHALKLFCSLACELLVLTHVSYSDILFAVILQLVSAFLTLFFKSWYYVPISWLVLYSIWSLMFISWSILNFVSLRVWVVSDNYVFHILTNFSECVCFPKIMCFMIYFFFFCFSEGEYLKQVIYISCLIHILFAMHLGCKCCQLISEFHALIFFFYIL